MPQPDQARKSECRREWPAGLDPECDHWKTAWACPNFRILPLPAFLDSLCNSSRNGNWRNNTGGKRGNAAALSFHLASLDLVLPGDWPLFDPVQIHPDFLDWFRAAYEQARGTLPEDARRYQKEHRHERWMEVLSLPR